jgi:hypothetical protein
MHADAGASGLATPNPEATTLGQINLPLCCDAKVNKEAEDEATKCFAEVFRKSRGAVVMSGRLRSPAAPEANRPW